MAKRYARLAQSHKVRAIKKMAKERGLWSAPWAGPLPPHERPLRATHFGVTPSESLWPSRVQRTLRTAQPTDCQAASLHFGTPRPSWPHFGRAR